MTILHQEKLLFNLIARKTVSCNFLRIKALENKDSVNTRRRMASTKFKKLSIKDLKQQLQFLNRERNTGY